jgi:hypothetical protein
MNTTSNAGVVRTSARVDKISSGRRLLPEGVDLRTRAALRFRHLVQTYTKELGGSVGEADQALVKTAAGLVLRSEEMQAALVSGQPVDNGELVRVASEARRILGMLRTKAEKAKPAGPNIHDLLDQIAEAAEAEA